MTGNQFPNTQFPDFGETDILFHRVSGYTIGFVIRPRLSIGSLKLSISSSVAEIIGGRR